MEKGDAMKLSRLAVAATISVAVLALLFFFVLWRPNYFYRHANKEHEVTAEQVYNSKNLAGLEYLAKKGNAEAAWTLFMYHAFIHRPHTTEDDAIGRKWLELAAENGKPEAILELASVVQNEGGPKNCARAVALVRKALGLTHDARNIRSAKNYLATFKESPDCAGLIPETTESQTK